MKKTRVEEHLPNAVFPLINQFKDRVRELDAANNATTPTEIDWTDMARAAVTLAKHGDTPAPINLVSVLQEVMAAKRAIREMPNKPQYIDENLLDDFVASVVGAVQSKAAGVTAKRDGDKGEIVLG